jgi:hypothetical protein
MAMLAASVERDHCSSCLLARTPHAGNGNPAGAATLTSEFHSHLVDETPGPVFSRFERRYDRMLRRPEVFRCMLVLRFVAAADVAASSAEAKMHPRIAGGEALFAPGRVGAIRHYKVEMAALRGHQRIAPVSQ